MKFEVAHAGDLKEGDLFVNIEKTPEELNAILSTSAAIGIYIRGKGPIPEEAKAETVYKVKVAKPKAKKDAEDTVQA